VFVSSRPSAGAHALVQRDAPTGAGSKEALTIMAPVGKDYRDLAVAAADAQVHIAGVRALCPEMAFCSLCFDVLEIGDEEPYLCRYTRDRGRS
jgi:hypothetical protein